jgi:adenosylhomocysteine nucleosidase
VETIGLMAAMPQESAALLRHIKGWKRISLDSHPGFHFQVNARDCILIISGMGMSKAQYATSSLLTITNPDLLISFGIAGAVKDDLNIGDIVIPRNTCLLTEGVPGQIYPITSLSKEAWNAMEHSLQPEGIRIFSGTAVTTNGSQVAKQEWFEIDNPILEMETAGISQVANKMNTPFLSIRSISDGPRSPIPFDLEAILDGNANIQIGRLLKLVLRRPKILFQSRQLINNSRKAANFAARAVLAILCQTSSLVSL